MTDGRIIRDETSAEAPRVHVTVGHADADYLGGTHRAIQSAVDAVAALGGGTVEVLPGEYELGNAIHLRNNVRLVGAGDRTVLRKNPSRVTPLADDIDWYEWSVAVGDAAGFEVGGGLLLRSKDVSGGANSITKHTIVGIDGNRLYLDSQPRKNHWITHEATAATLFPLVTANWAHDIGVENLTLDGNREQNDHLDGNYGGCIFMQDCERVTIRGVTARNNEGDGISLQICHNATIEDCRSVNNRDLGLHPGSGCQRPVIRNNRIADCGIGIFWCWGVKHGVAEGNLIERSRDYGISIGHRDTDNVMRHNRIVDSGKVGVYFRPETPAIRAAHRNLIEHNVIENVGGESQPGIGIDLAAAVEDVVIRHNRVINVSGRMAAGIRITAGVQRLTLEGNVFEGLATTVDDVRGQSE